MSRGFAGRMVGNIPIYTGPGVGKCFYCCQNRGSCDPSRGSKGRSMQPTLRMLYFVPSTEMGFLGGSDSKESACNEGDSGSILALGRSPGEGNGNPLQHSCLENPLDGGAWQARVHGVAKSERLHFHFHRDKPLMSFEKRYN